MNVRLMPQLKPSRAEMKINAFFKQNTNLRRRLLTTKTKDTLLFLDE